jgi:hypothetical protein
MPLVCQPSITCAQARARRLTDDGFLGLTGGIGNNPRDDQWITSEQESHEVVSTKSDGSFENVCDTLDVNHCTSNNDLRVSNVMGRLVT